MNPKGRALGGVNDEDEETEDQGDLVDVDEDAVTSGRDGEEELFEAEEADEFNSFAQEMDFSEEPTMHDRTSLEGQQFRDLQAAFAFLKEKGLFTRSDTLKDALRNGNIALGNLMLTTRKEAAIVLTEDGIDSILGEFPVE